MIPIRLLGPKVLVALEPKATSVETSTGMNYHQQEVTASGIILAQPTDMYDADEHSRGIVMALGVKSDLVSLEAAKAIWRSMEGRTTEERCKRLDTLLPAPFDVEVGDVVLFPPSAGVTLGEQADGMTYVVLHEKDLMAVLQPKSEAA